MGLLSFLRGPAKQPPVSIRDDNFEAEVIRSELPVLIDVWSPGCAPCKHLEPVFMEMAARYEGRVKICEMNTMGAPQATMALGVRGTPTFVFFKEGKPIETIVGVRSSLFFNDAIEQLFGEPKTAPSA